MKRAHLFYLVLMVLLGWLASTIAHATATHHTPEAHQEIVAVSPSAPTDGCVPAPSGLVGWWPFDGNAKDFRVTNNAELGDSDPSHSPAFVAGEVGQALQFDGVDDYGDVLPYSGLDVGAGDEFTIDLWIMPDDLSQQRPLLDWNDGISYGVHLWINVQPPFGTGNGSLYASIVDTAGNNHIISSAAGILQQGVWQHVALVFVKSASIALLYINGDIVATQAFGTVFTPYTNTTMWIGVRHPTYYYSGQMDEIEIFNRALSQSEIQSISRAGSAGKCKVRYVTNTGDNVGVNPTPGAGTGTLRQAIVDSDTYGAPNTIAFNIQPGGGVKTISPFAALPNITGSVTIDGTTQPGYAGIPLIELNGANAGSAVGLDCRSPTTIRGLVINGFANYGIRVFETGSGSKIVGNYIGTDAAGTFARGNTIGILIGASNNAIGGTTAAERNVISGNVREGIQLGEPVFLSAAFQTLVQGNYIGTNAAGNAPLGNGRVGIFVQGSNNTIGGTSSGARNIISGNGSAGIVIGGGSVGIPQGSTNNLVQGNFIGTDVTGTFDLGNVGDGIKLQPAGSGNTIGGTLAGARNVISGNGGDGIFISEAVTFVQGNYIGTNVTGTQPLGNSVDGIGIASGSNQIGGSAAATRNVISGNFQRGIQILGSDATLNLVQGNFIGVNAAGTSAIGNGREGVLLDQGASNNTVGLDVNGAGAGNTIAFNGGPLSDGWGGVRVDGAGATRNAIRGNSIFSNGGMGIDLSPPEGVNPNDPGAHTGANNLQNFPLLTSAISSGSTTIQGTFNSAAGTSFRIEFFANSACDSSGNGEGQTFIGFTNVNTNASGNGSFSLTVPTNSITGPYITATATDVNGNTSEFSQCLSTCIAMLSPTSASFPGNVGAGTPSLTGSIGVTMPAGCNWMAASNDSFITITGGSSGSGDGTVSYSLDPNPSNSTRRIGTITIANQTFTVLQGQQFLDVPTDYLFYTVIGKLAARGVTVGCGGGNYCPEANVPREQMAAFIIRALGDLNPPAPQCQRFSDVPDTNIFYAFIDELFLRGITVGCGSTPSQTCPANPMGTYCPSSSVTREQMAAFIIRSLGMPSPPAPQCQRFSDVPPSNPFYAFIDQMFLRGITFGCTNTGQSCPANPMGTYCPSQAVTRGQMAAFLVRAFGL